jgi:predicted MFS family arabinose efflux permease
VNLIYAVGAGAGAPLGGLLAERIGWRWSFIAQGPFCMLAIIAVATALHLPRQEDSHWKEKLAKIDFLGAFILIVAIFGLLVGLDRGSNVGWSNPITIAGLCTTPLFIVFVLIEKFVAKHPIAPGHIILHRSLIACYLCNFFSFSGWLAAIFFIPLYWQVTGGYNASQAGLLLMPSIIFGVSGSLFGGIYMKRTAKYYWITVIAYSHLTIGLSLVLLFAGTVMRSIPVMVVGTVISGFSNGIGVTTTLIGLSKSTCHKLVFSNANYIQSRMPRMPIKPLQQHAATSFAPSVLFSASQCAQRRSTRHCVRALPLRSVETRMRMKLLSASDRGWPTTEAWSRICKRSCASAMVKLLGRPWA